MPDFGAVAERLTTPDGVGALIVEYFFANADQEEATADGLCTWIVAKSDLAASPAAVRLAYRRAIIDQFDKLVSLGAIHVNGDRVSLRHGALKHFPILERTDGRPPAALSRIPAADRFVELNHNEPKVRDAREAVASLLDAVNGSNDLSANPEDRLAVISEVQSLQQILSAPRIRLSAIYAATKESSVIVWLAKEAASGVVRAAAAAAVGALATLLALYVGIG